MSDHCIIGSLRCNGKVDCPLGEDEKDCPAKTCPPDQVSFFKTITLQPSTKLELELLMYDLS